MTSQPFDLVHISTQAGQIIGSATVTLNPGQPELFQSVLSELRKRITENPNIDHELRCPSCRSNKPLDGKVAVRCYHSRDKKTVMRIARWPGSTHRCPQLHGSPAIKPIVMTPESLDALMLNRAQPDGHQFQLCLGADNHSTTAKLLQVSQGNIGAKPNGGRDRRSSPRAVQRRLTGLVVELQERARLNEWHEGSTQISNFRGAMPLLHEASMSPSFKEQFRSGIPILFPEAASLGDTSSEVVAAVTARAAAPHFGPKAHVGCAIIIGRLFGLVENPEDPKGLVGLHVTGMHNALVYAPNGKWKNAIKSFGPPLEIEPGSIHPYESLVVCVVKSEENRLVAKRLAWGVIDNRGLIFFGSPYEPGVAQTFYKRGYAFYKPGHVRFQIDGVTIWPDFIVRRKDGRIVIVEVDPDGTENKDAKIRKGRLYSRSRILFISFDPKGAAADDFPDLHALPEELP